MKLSIPDGCLPDVLSERDEAVFLSALTELDVSVKDGHLLIEPESLQRAFDIYFQRVMEVHY